MRSLSDRANPRAEGLRARARGVIVQLILTGALVVGIAAAGSVVSMGFADAQGLSGAPVSDASLVIAMLAAAVAVMGILSAAAVRWTGRPRH